MGHAKTSRASAARTALAILVASLLCLTLASPAQAAPTHPRKEALDITGLNHACGVAVDSKGNLYASSAGTNEVKVYDPSHNLLTSIPNSNEPCGLAVTTTGVLYVSEKATGEVVQFKPSKYPFAGTPTYGPREVIDASTKAKGIAVDSFDDALYVAEGDHVSAYVHEMQTLLLENEVTGGSFKLKFGGQETPSLPYNATAAEVQAALEALSSIEPGNVEVAEHPSTLSWTVFFTGKFAYTDVAEIGRDYSLLTGSNPRLGVIETAKGFSGPIGEGALTEATGVASYTAEPANGTPSPIDRHLWVADAKGLGSTDDSLVLFSGSKTSALKLRRELTGAATPDGSLGFGTAGAYLAADPGNIDAKKCAVVGEGACSAGHLFLYDAAHKALDEFDASGEYLGQTKNAAFADAEPTQVAVDRSGGAGDGTLYVTAGATTPASALAFGPLLQPKRETLPEPISHTLANARAVATDFYGNVYAAAGTKVSVFDPKGKALTSFTDTKGTPTDLAVDSTCKVYVLEGETKATYFTPTACPPVSGTTYARQESVVATGSGFRGIAVNPGPSAGKDRLFVTGTAVTREYDSAAKGSGPLNPEFAKDTVPSSALRESIAVNGANGSVYFGVNPHLIYVVDPTGKEILARIDTTVSTSGITGFNPRLAVDQANGHVIEFDGKSKSAREYEAVAGGFVAEFGSFTEELTKQYRVAVDSSCALHEPPLDETTTPTCEEFDPANGTVYVAFDDTNLSHPPFDVNAFGPVKYGTPPPATKFKLTVNKTGTGSGTVTSAPEGIDCGGTCSAEFEEGTKVTLTATPAGGSTFSGWSGACSGTASCEVTMSAAKSVTAEFSLAAKPKFLLKANLAGSGTGTVTSSPSGINCGIDCTEEYEEGTKVTLTGTPGANTKAVAWTGCGAVNGENKCEVTMSAAKEVTATFNLEQRQLTTKKTGTGTGKVTSSPAGIDCGATCSASFDHGTKVTLEAKADAGSEFKGWSGSGCSGIGKCEVTMSEAREVTAEFSLAAKPKFLLKANLAGSGTGTVASSPSGINCGLDCEEEYEEGTKVTLTGTPGANTKAVAWTGCGAVNGENKCEVTMSAAKEVTATFNLEQRQLTASKAGSGSGTVTSTPAGINCGVDCSELYDHGTEVTLEAKADAGSEFVEFTGDCGPIECELTMSEDKSVTALFDVIAKPKFGLKVKLAGSGTGIVTSSPSGINCGLDCEEEYEEGTKVTLTGTPGANTKAVAWTGCGAVNGENKCEVTMSAAKEVTATFDEEAKGGGIPLTVVVEGTGSGTVSSDKGAISCNPFCTDEYEAGTKVTLTATPASGSIFYSWKYCDTGGVNGRQCTVTVDKAKTVKATFTTTHALKVSRAGSGLGKVQSSPGGVLCLANCSETTAAFREGTKVTLKQTPSKHFHFVKWMGDCTGSGACEVTMGEDHDVSAEFAEDAKHLLTLTKQGGGQGTVKSSIAGINCGATCAFTKAAYYQGEAVELMATPGKGSTFKGWTGCESEPEGRCLVTVSEAKEVKAKFE